MSEDGELVVWAIVFDNEVFGLYRTEESAQEHLLQQVEAGGPAWDGCEVVPWTVGK